MIVLKTINARQGLDGRTYVMANIQSDDTPEPMPRTGAGIEGMSNDAAIDVGSRLYVLNTSTEYVLGEDWNWYEWRAASGGGGGDTDNLVESISSAVTPGEDFDTYAWSYTRGDGTKIPIVTQQVPNRVGADGSTTTPHVTQDAPDRATISWTNDQGEPVPDPVTIIAPQGEKGEAGRDGFDPVIEPTATEDGYNLLIITADGQHEIDLHNGRDGTDGAVPDITITATQDGVKVPVTKSGEGAAQTFAFAFAGSGSGDYKIEGLQQDRYGAKIQSLLSQSYVWLIAKIGDKYSVKPGDKIIITGTACITNASEDKVIALEPGDFDLIAARFDLSGVTYEYLGKARSTYSVPAAYDTDARMVYHRQKGEKYPLPFSAIFDIPNNMSVSSTHTEIYVAMFETDSFILDGVDVSLQSISIRLRKG